MPDVPAFFCPVALRLAACLLALAVTARAQDSFDLLTGAAFLQTGGGSTLVRTNRQWTAPAALSHPALIFTFGFATDEVLSPGEFADSFTVTVRNGDRSFVAPVLTEDLFGLTSAPENPDGAQFTTNQVQPEALPFPALGSTFRFQQAFLVLVVLPPALAGQTGSVSAALFDNLDSRRSVAFLNNVAIVPGPGTPFTLESSASVIGPYAFEDEFIVRHAHRSVTLARAVPHRFFQLRGGSQARITQMTSAGTDWVFSYTGGGAGETIESSAQVTGPYAAESGVRADAVARTARLPKEGGALFFRIRSDIPLLLHGLRREAGQFVISYE